MELSGVKKLYDFVSLLQFILGLSKNIYSAKEGCFHKKKNLFSLLNDRKIKCWYLTYIMKDFLYSAVAVSTCIPVH